MVSIFNRLKHVTNEVTLLIFLKNADNLYRYRKALHTWTCGPYAMTEAKGPSALCKKLVLVTSENFRDYSHSCDLRIVSL